tara:strand:+ start:542 stop:1030 length:489 start_codon:yes stop_codon:yes gene_type:complete
MRGYWTFAALALAGCSAEQAPPPEQEDAPIVLKAGQWTLSRTITGYNTPDITAEDYARMVGTKAEAKLCIAVGKDGRPDADALAGPEGKDCTYKDASIRKGRFIATLACKADGGTSELVLEGNYTPESLTLGSSMTKTVGGKAVLRTTHDLSGKRTGDCAAG